MESGLALPVLRILEFCTEHMHRQGLPSPRAPPRLTASNPQQAVLGRSVRSAPAGPACASPGAPAASSPRPLHPRLGSFHPQRPGEQYAHSAGLQQEQHIWPPEDSTGSDTGSCWPGQCEHQRASRWGSSSAVQCLPAGSAPQSGGLPLTPRRPSVQALPAAPGGPPLQPAAPWRAPCGPVPSRSRLFVQDGAGAQGAWCSASLPVKHSGSWAAQMGRWQAVEVSKQAQHHRPHKPRQGSPQQLEWPADRGLQGPAIGRADPGRGGLDGARQLPGAAAPLC